MTINIQGTASEATLVALLSAKSRTLSKLKQENPDADVSSLTGRLVAYASGNPSPVKSIFSFSAN